MPNHNMVCEPIKSYDTPHCYLTESKSHALTDHYSDCLDRVGTCIWNCVLTHLKPAIMRELRC